MINLSSLDMNKNNIISTSQPIISNIKTLLQTDISSEKHITSQSDKTNNNWNLQEAQSSNQKIILFTKVKWAKTLD